MTIVAVVVETVIVRSNRNVSTRVQDNVDLCDTSSFVENTNNIRSELDLVYQTKTKTM